ncbi:MAG: hypothetical protein R3Y24_06175 [Eubacteriales bacterium]
MMNLWSEIKDDKGRIDTPFRFSSWRLMYRCPFFDFANLSQNMYSGLDDYPIDFLEIIIEKGYYCMISYDTFYIPVSRKYKKSIGAMRCSSTDSIAKSKFFV